MKRGSRLEEIFAYLREEKAVDRPTSAIFDLHLIFLLLCLFGYKFSFLGILCRFLREGANCRAELSNGFCCWSKSERRKIQGANGIAPSKIHGVGGEWSPDGIYGSCVLGASFCSDSSGFGHLCWTDHQPGKVLQGLVLYMAESIKLLRNIFLVN